LSTQSLFKYLPQHDDIYPRIALKVPRACFVFIGNQSTEVTERFMQRLRQAFKRHDLDADRFCHISPRLNGNDFLSLNLAADVLLDTLEWSGGKTTLEAIDCGLPVVASPGRFMRGRHAYAMLKMMGLTETIADDKSAYCHIAVELANDQPFYEGVKKRLLDNRRKLYGDKIFINGLERFYKSIVQQKLGAQNG
jgi:predicted O-linked N-acetylglucosamine transferase (SPINDLY family)